MGERRAGDDLAEQLKENEGSELSLTSMWRACGEPEGLGPVLWLDLARPFIEGLRIYSANLEEKLEGRSPKGVFDELTLEPSVWVADDSHRGVFNEGDLLTTQPVASAYSYFLDGSLNRRAELAALDA